MGKKWTLPLLQQIDLYGDKGFNELMRQMKKVSPKILTERLKALEAQKIIRKETTESDQTRTAYATTEKGKELQVILTRLRAWNMKHDAATDDCAKRECVTCERY